MAIIALCLFWVPIAGLVLSIIGMKKTAHGRAYGRGLAIGALVLSIIITGLGVFGVGATSLKSSALDPGCKGMTAVRQQSVQLGIDEQKHDEAAQAADIHKTIAELSDAAAAARRDDVRSAIQALHDDSAGLLTGTYDSTKAHADEQQVDQLCTVGK